MRHALQQIKASGTNCIGTLTLDSYTRGGDYAFVEKCLAEDGGGGLNGYPIVNHPPSATRDMLGGLLAEDFPIQVRHGTPRPLDIFKRMVALGLDATEGGPVSYCLPYGRVALEEATRCWREASRFLAQETTFGHLESFGGCLMGQLCPPSLLIAMSILECMFFRAAGMRSVSMSYAQGPSHPQNRAALKVLRELAGSMLGDVHWHVVVYTYMGVFPATKRGAAMLIEDSARLARQAGCERLIVKTTIERRQIPSVFENVHALQLADRTAASVPADTRLGPEEQAFYEEIREETTALLDAVLNQASEIGEAILLAFKDGILDVPYCIHADNAGLARSIIDGRGALRWAALGKLPFSSAHAVGNSGQGSMTAAGLLRQLNYVADTYDRAPSLTASGAG